MEPFEMVDMHKKAYLNKSFWYRSIVSDDDTTMRSCLKHSFSKLINEKLIEKESTDNFLKYVLDIHSALIHIPTIKLNDERINLIKNGMKVSLVNEFGKVSLENIYTEALDKPLALGYLKSGFFYPKRVFN